jgi:WD40 repeat protein
LWDPETGKRKSWLVADGKGSPLAAAFTPDSKQVVVGYGVRNWDNGKDWTARLWSVSDGKVVREFAGHTNGAHMLAISPDGKQLATCDSSTQIRLWELGTGKLKREIDWAERGIRSAIAFPKADKVIGVTARSGPEVVDLLSGESLKQLKSQHQASSVIFTPDGQKIGLLGHPTYHPTICDATSGEILQTFEDVRVRELAVMAFRADGRYLAVSGIFKDLSEVGRVRLYDVKTGELVRTIQHTAPVSAIAFSPNGTRLATGSYDTTVLIWDLTTKP